MLSAPEVLDLLRAYPDAAMRDRFMEFVRSHPADFADRHNPAGHLTASAWITDETGTHALLVRHAKLGLLIQPGGHVEPEDETMADASAREGREETGIRNLRLSDAGIFDLDIHVFPARSGMPEHRHYDVRFRFSAERADFLAADPAETEGGEWVDIREILQDGRYEASVAAMARKTAVSSGGADAVFFLPPDASAL